MAPLRILHLSNDFLWTKVHRNLYAQLDQLGVRQEIFTPLRRHSNPDNNRIDFAVPGSAVRFSGVLSGYHRVLFRQKIRKLFRDLDAFDIVGDCDLIHATTLFSDGALAYEAFKKYGKPYIVSVRNTDINMFLKFKPHLIFLVRKILDNAQRLVFISQSNFDNFFNHPLAAMFADAYRSKAVVINNGIDRLWLDNRSTRKRASANEILFIGRFDRNKNAVRLIRAFLELRAARPHLRLSLVGSHGVQQGNRAKTGGATCRLHHLPRTARPRAGAARHLPQQRPVCDGLAPRDLWTGLCRGAVAGPARVVQQRAGDRRHLQRERRRRRNSVLGR